MWIDNFATYFHFQTLKDDSADSTIKEIQLVTGPHKKGISRHTLLHDDNINPNFPERTE